MSNPFREKLLTLQISPKVRQTSARKNYYDSSVPDQLFGEDHEERALEETKGLGPAYRSRDGSFWRKDRISKEWLPVDDQAAETYLGADTEQEAG
jgi:hypothetical protein